MKQSEEAKAEARILMNGANNILDPKNGKPIVTPSQDMVLGNCYLTIEEAGFKVNFTTAISCELFGVAYSAY